MSEDSLHLTLSGDLAAAIRSTAEAAGVTPQQWMQQAVRARLGAAIGAPQSPSSAAASQLEWDTVTEPTGTFTVPLPRGWHHQLANHRTPTGSAPVFNTTSPDGGTTIYGNDPELKAVIPGLASLFGGGSGNRQAAGYGADYLTRHYGRLPGFRVTGSAPLPEMVQLAQQSAARAGHQPAWYDAALVTAEFSREGAPATLAALVLTLGLPMGGAWVPAVTHVVSSGQATSFVPACLHMYGSYRVTPVGQQLLAGEQMMRQQQHEATMANIRANTAAMTAAHNDRMANMRAQNDAFQAGLADRQQAFDAGVDSWRAQQAASSVSPASNDHRNFLNMIKEEETVVDRQGWEHQVEAGPDKYYYNDHQEKFIGLEQHQDIHDVPGINPDDWYETPIQR